MKRIIQIAMLLLFATASYAQIRIDNGGLSDPGTRYVLKGSKWN